jgi:predicted alpha/beta-fold hydrolase
MSTAAGSQDVTSVELEVPEFVPHPWLRNGHVQTLVGRYLGGPRVTLPSVYHEIDAGDGDRLASLTSTPEGWRPGGPSALLVHGLSGCARAPYVVRVAHRLWNRGVRVVRMNLRGAGSGFGRARGIYHAGRTEDLRRVVEWMVRRAPDSPVALVGFSLGASLVLKLAAEAATSPLDNLDCVLAANPPIDLAACCRHMREEGQRVYDLNFARRLRADVARLHRAFPELGPPDLPKSLTLFDFDDHYTAPRNGFAGADDYYARSSVASRIPEILVPGLVVHAADDPFIPAETFRRVPFPSHLALELITGGGHLGYLSHRPWMGARRWLDARITAWLSTRWALDSNRPDAQGPAVAGFAGRR